jgi:hypothetical protein
VSRWSADDELRSEGVEPSPDRSNDRVPEVSLDRVSERIEVRTLSEVRDAPDRDRDRNPDAHHFHLPHRDAREPIVHRGHDYRLRGSEVVLMETIGQFRAVFVDDLARETSDEGRLNTDVDSLERQGLLETRTITRLSDEQTADVVALTREGKTLLDDCRDPAHDAGQEYYGGWVKSAELWHDASLFHMVRDVATESEREGVRVTRVILDDELKAIAFRALHRARASPVDSDADAHALVSERFGIAVENGPFVFPDVRLELQDAHGDVRTMDLELVTRHYHAGHLSGKAKAGFRLFRGGQGGGERRGGTPDDPTRRR